MSPRLRLTVEEANKLLGKSAKEKLVSGDEAASTVQQESKPAVYCKHRVVVYQWCVTCHRQLCPLCFMADPCRIEPSVGGGEER